MKILGWIIASGMISGTLVSVIKEPGLILVFVVVFAIVGRLHYNDRW